MKNTVLSFCTLLLFLTSCQKELSLDGSNGSNNNGTVLVKSVSKTGSDSSVTIYDYNSANQLTSQKITGVSGGMSLDLETTIKRNAQGIINELVLKSDEFLQYGIDNVTTKVNHNPATNRYTSKITKISFMGFEFTDSIAINYDANGRVISEVDYLDDGVTGYEQTVKTEYTYNGNNVASVKMSSFDAVTSTWTVVENMTFEYDTKVNPLQNIKDAAVLGMTSFFSANNGTKFTMASPVDPTTDQSTTFTYTYNSNNRPASGTSTTTPGNIQSQHSFYYK